MNFQSLAIDRELSAPLRYLAAFGIFAVALGLRFLVLPVEAGLAFLIFYPGTAVAALLCGPVATIAYILAAAGIGGYIFLPPHGAIDAAKLVPTMAFLFSAGTILLVVHTYQRRVLRLNADLERRVAERTVELQRRNGELDDFAYIASHDLKEPLRGLHNYASFLHEDYADRLDDDGRHYLERMQRLAERMTALIDGLLAYSRLGSADLPMEVVAMDPLLDDVTEDLRAFLAEQGVRLVRDTPLPTVRANALRLREVFQNLITNAAKYNDKAEKTVHVGCDGATPPTFHVRDNGIGIPPQHQDSVFRIFKRLHEQNKYGGGTGAGLTIVKKIVERHGGRIWLESTPGEGTTIRFTLAATPRLQGLATAAGGLP